MKKVYLTLVIAILFLSFFGCTEDSVNNSPTYTIVGKWEKTIDTLMTIILEFKVHENGIGEFVIGVGTEGLTGNYKIVGNEITFTDPECEGIEGKYQYEVDAQILKFTIIDDECEGRGTILSGIWTKVE